MYGWIIDQDYLEPGSVEEGTLGPSTIPPIVAEKLFQFALMRWAPSKGWPTAYRR